MKPGIWIALIATLASGLPAHAGPALERIKSKVTDASYEASFSIEAPLAAGRSVVVENLIGSLTLEGNGAGGRVVVETRIVADADTAQAAREMAEGVTVERSDAGIALVFRTHLPVERHLAFRFPRSEAEGPFAKWILPLLKRGKVAYPWNGSTVSIGNERGAAALAVHLVVKVPHDAVVTLRQIAGGIRTAHTRGTLLLDNVDGGIVSEQTYGSLDARSAGGEVAIRTFRGDTLAARTGSRDVELVDVRARTVRLATGNGWVRGRFVEADDLVVESTGGTIELENAEAGSFRVVAGSGDVDVTSLLKDTHRARLASSSGNVVLRVGDISRFELEARSGKGSIATKGLDGLETISSSGDEARYRFRGGGGAAVTLESGSGGVTIARAE